MFDPVDRITTGALGRPGERTFVIQAGRGEAALSVVVEKEQVAVLSARVLQLLAELDEYIPENEDDALSDEMPAVVDEPEPLFRARMMRLGFDPDREMVVLELFEDVPDEVEEADEIPDELDELEFESAGHVARFFATRAQMRAVAVRGAAAVAAGRPTCRLCMLPMDPDGHNCPGRN